MSGLSSPGVPYASAAAFRAALRARLSAAAKASGSHGLDELQRQFAYDRLLARAFTGPDSRRWVLKGAGALLARLPQARHSRDLDLAFLVFDDGRVDDELDEAVGSLLEAADRDLGDHFRFEVVRVSPLQEAAKGRRLHLVAYLGARYAAFHVDVVVGTAMTGVPEPAQPLTSVDIPGLVRPTYRLFPLTDHIADKLCAIVEVHDQGGVARPSTRIKDLVDLALIASTQCPQAKALRHAVVGGCAHRGLPLPERFAVPDVAVWRAGYPAKAREATGVVPDFAEAVELVAALLDPVLTGTAVGVWDPTSVSWSG
ncbi:nucleotidyl transferase AbiEii/AbiGii toxin family protein [Plantactinospora sp. WMMB334]|uniref:nucleotidyl transferase AbiEii/AbiGii toxin family protein n=1 Tax=Plantactinospora sp. WMMB334 TaxID=3404119 RepID=UPI003B946B66